VPLQFDEIAERGGGGPSSPPPNKIRCLDRSRRKFAGLKSEVAEQPEDGAEKVFEEASGWNNEDNAQKCSSC
jgi:hypothetical protein